MTGKPTLIVIGGPTASGKTDLAIELAEHYNTEIISADSRQFYREISIGTAKPAPEQLERVKHHFIDSLSIHQDYTAADYERDVLKLLEELFRKHEKVILAGGSGLFIKAVTEGLDALPGENKEIRDALETELLEKGLASLAERLQGLNPEKAAKTDLQNPRRVIRALEIQLQPEKKTIARKARNFNIRSYFLNMDRQKLYERINLRVDKMMEVGLLQEAKSVYPFKHLNSLQTVGYKELFSHLAGEISLDEAIYQIKQHTRNYAKRQITWFRNQGEFEEIEASELLHRLKV